MNLGIDLGGTNIDAGLLSDEGKIIEIRNLPTQPERGYIEVTNDIGRIIKELSEKYNIQKIGIGIPGTVIREEGIVDFACNVGFKNFNIVEKLQKYLNVPVYIDNDANCAALGEALYGAAKDYKSSITITVGTGIGGGFVINKKIYRGFNGSAGEIGHMVIERNGLQCSCGRRGCFEKYGSTFALIQQAKDILNGEPSIIKDMVSGDLDEINGKIIFSAARQKDKAALRIIEEYSDYLAEGIANLINIFEPEIIVLGGAVSMQGEFFVEPIRNKVYKLVYSKTLPHTKIEYAKLGTEAGIVGAANL